MIVKVDGVDVEINSRCFNALTALISTIEATGGVVRTWDGMYEPAGDPEWVDLGDAYVLACHALGRVPQESSDES